MVTNEGHGFFRVPCPGHVEGDVVVQPRPHGQFCVFREHQVEPERFLLDDRDSAVAKALELAEAAA